jgi:hypothetical protein
MRLPLAVLILLALPAVAPRPARAEGADLAALARTAVGEDAAAAERAITALRAAGPSGLAALMPLSGPVQPRVMRLAIVVRDGKRSLDRADPKAEEQRIAAAIDRVAAQKDARYAGLYWHTDEAEALRLAAAERKPVLSLRLLGRLDQDMSCANSRFFRTALYPDPAVGELLREHFVLHWASVRPVPRLTIDFGDGRVLERPITGNSAHLVLDARGRVIDAIPGLVGPGTFVRLLEQGRSLAGETRALDGEALTAALARHHEARIAALDSAWTKGLEQVAHAPVVPSAIDAPELWQALGALDAPASRLSPAGRALFEVKHHAGFVNRLTVGKAMVEDPLMTAMLSFEASLAAESVRNEQRIHRLVHGWFAARDASPEAAAVADRLYREVFLTPPEDPWLGLLPDGVYAALDGGGVSKPAPAPAR